MAEWPGQAQGDPVGPLRDERSGRPWGWRPHVDASAGSRPCSLQAPWFHGHVPMWKNETTREIRKGPRRVEVPHGLSPRDSAGDSEVTCWGSGRTGMQSPAPPCDLGQVAQPLRASVLSSVKRDKP